MAIPVINLEFGRELSIKEAKSLVEKMKANEEFKKIAAELDPFNADEIEVLAANKAEFVAEGQDRAVFVNRIVVRDGNKVVSYQESTKDGMTKEVVTAAVLESKELLTTLMVHAGEVVITPFNHTGEDIQVKDFAEGLPNNENYVEGQSENEIKPAYTWGDGCYPGYKHCGRNCGDNGDYGGGTPINPYDTCCRTHDRCWAAFGTNDCQCDCQLEACAKKNWIYAPVALHTILLAYFPVKDSCTC